MFYSELNQILLREKSGYLVNLKYDRFVQMNFPDENKSLVIVADFKDFEIVTSRNGINITINEDRHVSTYELRVHDLDNEERALFNTNKGNIIVIAKELSDRVHIDGLMILSNKETILDLITYFSVDSDIVIKIPFSKFKFDYLTTFINKVGRMVTGIELDNIMETDGDGNTVPIPGISISVKYNLLHELEKDIKNVETNQLKMKTIQRLKEMRNTDRIISDEELTELLEDYSELSQENSSLWFVETEYTEEDHMRAYSKLCDDVRKDYHNDGKIEFIYDPSVRNAITDRNAVLK